MLREAQHLHCSESSFPFHVTEGEMYGQLHLWDYSIPGSLFERHGIYLTRPEEKGQRNDCEA